MVSESGSEPSGQQGQQQDREDTRPGWSPIIKGRRFYQLQPTHPTYPPEWERQFAADCATLSQDERLHSAISMLRILWTGARSRMDAIQRESFATWYAEWEPIFQEVWNAIRHTAENIGHSKINPSIRRAYLAEQIDPQVRNWFPPGAPVEIMINAEDEPFHLVEPLAPGEVMVRFSGIKTEDLLRSLPFVTEAQAIAGRRHKTGPKGNDQLAINISIARERQPRPTAIEICEEFDHVYNTSVDARGWVRYWGNKGDKLRGKGGGKVP